MKVLLLGTGAALHALAWKIVSEGEVEQVHCSPGNAGTALLVGRAPFSPEHGAEVAQWAFSQQVGLVVVQGMPSWADMLTDVELPVLGVGLRQRQALSSRQAIRELLQPQGVPCPESRTLRDLESAERYLASQRLPVQIRSDNVALRERVRVTDRYAAFQQLSRLFSLDPTAGVSIEAEVPGREATLTLLSDGQRAMPLGVSRPYDHRYEGDAGPLTGGMGSYAPYGDRAVEERLMEEVGRPVIAALATAGLLRPAFLQLRIALSEMGPVLLDLAWDLDDLHAAVTLPLWEGDLSTVLAAAAQGNLQETLPAWRPGVTVAVAIVAESYPGSSPGGQPLPGSYEADALVFHDATRMGGAYTFRPAVLPAWLRPAAPPQMEEPTRQVLTAGGRALLVVGWALNGAEARRRAYAGVEQLKFEHCAWRRDIAAEL